MADQANGSGTEAPTGPSGLLPILLAMAMFVLVVDTSLMNVSIAAVVRDLDTTTSGVQSAIALEALVSAAFILIGGKVGDLIGRKRAYVLGLLGYATGAAAMTVAQGLGAIIVFWAVIGGIGASLLLPAMQSLIHGNFDGAMRTKVYALVGAAAAIAAAVGPLLGGFITTYLSWRLGFALEVLIIAVVLSGIRLVRDVPYTGPRGIDVVGSALSVRGNGGHRPGHPGLAGGRRRRRRAPRGRSGRARIARVLAAAAQAAREACAAGPRVVPVAVLPVGDHPADAAADRPGRHHDRAADLPADGAGVQRDAGGPVTRPALAEHVRGCAARREEGRRPTSEQHHPIRLPAPCSRDRGAHPDRAPRRVRVGTPDPAGRSPARAWACWSRS